MVDVALWLLIITAGTAAHDRTLGGKCVVKESSDSSFFELYQTNA